MDSNRQHCAVAKARKFGVLLAAQLVNGFGSELGVSVVGLPADNEFPCLPATLTFRLIRRIAGGDFISSASADFGAGAMAQAIKMVARDRASLMPPANQSLKYVPGPRAVHRMPLSGHRLASR